MRLIAVALALLTMGSTTGAQPDTAAAGSTEEGKLDGSLLGGLAFRSIGPALMSGRIGDLAVDPTRPNTWYVAVGSGGVWKTINAGTTWEPIFDNYGSYSIGCVTIDPNHPDRIWVGTGEAVGGRHVGYGDGVYVSHDGGGSFTRMGLTDSEHIARILVDPRDSNVVFVAAQGPLWSPGRERGLYKSTDGGHTWAQILARGPYTGVTDVAFDPRNPDVVYAATHQRHRTVWALVNGGPETGIHKSTDGGVTWRELKSGLPGGDMGKIALAVSPQRPDVVYASIELAARAGGFWRSANGGESWAKMSDYVSGGTGPHYYQEIWADPHRFDVLYQANVVIGRTEDGGKTWNPVGRSSKHVDNHAVAFHPTDPDFLLVGCDGGLYKSYDRGQTYAFTANLPLTQFYKVDVDYDWPVYHVVGGTQDNNTQYGPTRTLSRNGIRNSDWRITIGGDGHDCAIDPEDPNILYCESQQGYLRRFDRRTGESVDVRPQPEKGEENLRFNWDSPIHISPHDHKRIFHGSRKLHRSNDRGDSWTAISGDLSRGLDRLTLKIMGRVWSADAIWDLWAMSMYGNVTSVSESPLVDGLIYVGTDDGLIQITEDGGSTWRKVERIYGIPEMAFVNDIKADLHDPDTVYAVLDDHKTGDYSPYLLKSIDRGRTWHSIVGDLPDRHLLWRIIQDHVDPDLLFLGSEFGVFVTTSGGESWSAMRAGMPKIPARDLEIQRRENDLVVATFGRSFYVLDDYTPLRHLGDDLEGHDLVIFPIRKALQYIPQDMLGGEKGSQGDSYFVAANPPYGATITYYLRESFQTRKQARQEQEAEKKKAGGDTPYPGWDALEEEERERAPELFFEIRDSGGELINRVSGSTSKGIHRISWNLRYAPFPSSLRGPLALPGQYHVQAYRRVEGTTTALGEPRDFEVVSVGEPSLPPQDRAAVLEFHMSLGELQRSVSAARSVLTEAITEVTEMRSMVEGERRVELGLLDEVRKLELKLLDAQKALVGEGGRNLLGRTGFPSITSRLGNALFGTMNNTHGPTRTQRRQVEIAREEYQDVIGTIRGLVDDELPKMRKRLDDAGAAWTKGRKIPRIREKF